ncbi:MAG: 2'-5' RNA ligase family protein [Pseudomonadota bacterium]
MMTQDEAEMFAYREILLTVDVPSGIAERLGKIAAALAKVSDPAHIDAFWIPPELMHVTLLHLGRVREDLVDVIQTRVNETLRTVAPFTCSVGRLDPNGNPEAEDPEQAPGALWAMVEDPDGVLSELHDKVAEALEDLGVQHHSAGPFVPHIPVALFAKFRNTREFGSVMLEHTSENLGELPVRELVVLENRAADGQRDQPFRPLKRLELAGG